MSFVGQPAANHVGYALERRPARRVASVYIFTNHAAQGISDEKLEAVRDVPLQRFEVVPRQARDAVLDPVPASEAPTICTSHSSHSIGP
jgi:hypothetical protein